MIVSLQDPETGERRQQYLGIEVVTAFGTLMTPRVVDAAGQEITAGNWIARQGRVIYAEQHERTVYPAWIGWLT